METDDTIVSTGERIVEGPDGPEVIPAGARNLGDRRVRGYETFFLSDISFFVTLVLAAFAAIFGTRHTDATEHQVTMFSPR